jgi:tRNA wybutosine-synthesizing protein 1
MVEDIGNVREKLRRMNYALVGGTSAVQVCRWTKNSLRGDRGCWKEKFYGISSAGCCQMSPSVMWCENQCLHCWRPIEMNLGTELPMIDDPIDILNGVVAERKKLLRGFGGRKGIDFKKLERAMEPSLYTMSLSGEATLYPRLSEMFKEIRRQGAVSFLVTNGLNPQVIKNLDVLPTQITISMNAPNKDLFLKWHRSSVKNAWEKFNESLNVIRELKGKVRRAVRLTLVKGENMSDENVDEYVDLIRKAEPDFVHVKGFKSIGYARDRLGYDKQVWFDGVRDYALKILEKLDGYKVGGEDERCCVVMLARDGVELKIGKV